MIRLNHGPHPFSKKSHDSTKKIYPAHTLLTLCSQNIPEYTTFNLQFYLFYDQFSTPKHTKKSENYR